MFNLTKFFTFNESLNQQISIKLQRGGSERHVKTRYSVILNGIMLMACLLYTIYTNILWFSILSSNHQFAPVFDHMLLYINVAWLT